MNYIQVSALMIIAGVAILLYEFEQWRRRRQQAKRLMKIVMCAQSCDEQERREEA